MTGAVSGDPRVAVIYGSVTEHETMAHVGAMLGRFGVVYDETVISPHRSPRALFDWCAALEPRGVEVVVQDIPLLFENKLEGLFSSTVLVYLPAELQVERLVGRGMAEPDARARIANQLPIEEKRARATYVIDNSGTREATRAQTEKVWSEITGAGSDDSGGGQLG